MKRSSLAKVLTLLRILRGLSQDEFAKLAGVRPGSVSDYERGRITPGLPTLLQLLGALRYPLAAIDRAHAFVLEMQSLEVALPGTGRLVHRPDVHDEVEWLQACRRAEDVADAEALIGDGQRFAGRLLQQILLALGRLPERPLGEESRPPEAPRPE
jgi:transcriptional regulator with XRE-family HTH domain